MRADVVNAVDVSVAVDVDVSREVSKETPSNAPQTPDWEGPRRSMRRPRPEFIRDVRRLITASWLAKTGQKWRWTPLDRFMLWDLSMRKPAWEIMALWDCYIARAWRDCAITHFCDPGVMDALGDHPLRSQLARLYRDRLYCKRGMKSKED